MFIAKIENNAVTEIGDYREMFPEVSFPASGPDTDFMADKGCLPVNLYLEHDQSTQKLESTDPYIQSGNVYTIKVVDRTAEDLAAQLASVASGVRATRDALLAACDWTQVADAPVDKAVWNTYRQALRDVPIQEGFPTTVTWPTMPV